MTTGLSAPRILFGVHSISPYSRVNKLPYGILKVIGSADLAMSCSVEELYGGASKFSWAAETKTIASNVTAKVKSFPGFLFSLFMGASDTVNAAETTGSVSALANYGAGTSVVSATTGISGTLTLTSSDNSEIIFGSFVIVAVTDTTVDVYAMSDVDFARDAGSLSYQNNALKITTTPLTVTSTTATPIPGIGISFTGGSGTIGMTVGDTAFFTSRPINTGSEDIVIGASTTVIPAFGAVFLSQRRATAEMFEIEAYNVVAAGIPIPMSEMAFSQTELKMSLIYDSVQNAVLKIRACASVS